MSGSADDLEDTTFVDIRTLAMARHSSLRPFSSMYTDVRCRQLEGTFPGDPMQGVWPISAQRIGRGWGAVHECDWPSVHGAEWPGVEPVGLDAKAKRFRTVRYQRVRSPHDCRVMLAHEKPVNLAVEITNQWFDAPHGLIRMPVEGDEIVGSHAVTVLAFDFIHRWFRFQNSWGIEWGRRGYGFLPFAYFDKHLVDAWATHEILNRPKYEEFEGIDRISWGYPDVLGNSGHGGDVQHCREVYDGTNDEHLGWTFAVHREGFLDIEDFFVRPQYRGQGVANQLIEMLLDLSRQLHRPLRLWVSFADWTEEQRPRVEIIAGKLGLKLFGSGVRWAAMVGVDPAYVESSDEPSVTVAEKPSMPAPMRGFPMAFERT
jgi:GNAT superfamily N-acetyltransferase